MWDRWMSVFRQKLGREDRTLVSELIATRNRHAHREDDDISNRDTYRVLDGTSRLLRAFGVEAKAAAVERLCEETLGVIAATRKGPVADKHFRRYDDPKLSGKYLPIFEFLKTHQKEIEIPMSLAEVEKVLGQPLPRSAYRYPAWWGNSLSEGNTHPQMLAWRMAGFKANATVRAKTVVFRRDRE